MQGKIQYGRTIHCLPQGLKSTFVDIPFKSGADPKEPAEFQKTVILAFEVIVKRTHTFVIACFFPFLAYYAFHNELKYRKKSISAGQCTVCLKG